MTRPEIPPPSSDRLVTIRDGAQVIVLPRCVIDEVEKHTLPPPNEGGIVGWAVVAAVLVAVVWGVVAYLR